MYERTMNWYDQIPRYLEPCNIYSPKWLVLAFDNGVADYFASIVASGMLPRKPFANIV